MQGNAIALIGNNGGRHPGTVNTIGWRGYGIVKCLRAALYKQVKVWTS